MIININDLYESVITHDYDDFIHLISRNYTLMNTTNNIGETLLHHCAYWGKVDKLEALIGMGAEIKSTNNGDTLLHYCISSGNDAYLMTDLIKHGFSLLTKNMDGRTPIHYGGDILMLSYIKNWLEINNINSSRLTDDKGNTFSHCAKMLSKNVAYEFWIAQHKDIENKNGLKPYDVLVNIHSDIKIKY